MISLSTPLRYLRQNVTGRFALYFGKAEVVTVDASAYMEDGSPFAQWMEREKPKIEEYIALLLALAPHVQTSFFDDLIKEFLPDGGDMVIFGGSKASQHRGILPTGETLLFVLAGDDVEERLRVQHFLRYESRIFQQGILTIEAVPFGEPFMSGRLVLAEEVLEYWLTGTVSRPRFSTEFAAQYISTEHKWSDLVLNEHTLSQIQEIENWVTYHQVLTEKWGMSPQDYSGYRALFHGPPGTGKTMVAKLLGKSTGLDVFKIDLSKIVSKYIGETEKNLARIFDKAEHKQWILFFDEADALFGKRTEVRDAHDKYANQEVSYLLQRIEQYNGLIILASNFMSNIDQAFLRRFQNIIYFPIPSDKERLQLWDKAFPLKIKKDSNIDFNQIANDHELTGSNIKNIAYYCCIELAAQNKNHLDMAFLKKGIKREMIKEGKI